MRAESDVVLDHLVAFHAVDVIGSEYCHDSRPLVVDQIKALIVIASEESENQCSPWRCCADIDVT